WAVLWLSLCVDHDQQQASQIRPLCGVQLDGGGSDDASQTLRGQQLSLLAAPRDDFDVVAAEQLVPDARQQRANRAVLSVSFDDHDDPRRHDHAPPEGSSCSCRFKSASSRSSLSMRCKSASEYSSLSMISRLALSSGVMLVFPPRLRTTRT